MEAIGQGGAFIDYRPAMGDQLLEQTGLTVLGFPGFEFVAVIEKQLGQILSVFAIVFSATGDEGLAVFLQRDRVDRIKGDPIIGFQEGDEMAGGLLQTNGHAGFGMALAQVQQPLAQFFRRAIQGLGARLASSGVDEVKVGLTVGTVQTDDQVIFGIAHCFNDVVCVYVEVPPQA